MKKIILIIISLFLITINVDAITKSDVKSNIDSNRYNLLAGDYYCVYVNNNDYRVIVFKKNSSGFKVYPKEVKSGYTYQSLDEYTPDNLKMDSNGSLLLSNTSSINCDDYYYGEISEGASGMYYIYSKSKAGAAESSDFVHVNDTSIKDGLVSSVDVENKGTVTTTITVNGTEYKYVASSNNFQYGHFEADNGVWLCYVTLKEDNEFSYVLQSAPATFKVTSNMTVTDDTTGICNNGKLVYVKQGNNTGQSNITIKSETNLKKVAKYKKGLSSNVITIYYDNNSKNYIAMENNSNITINNLNSSDSKSKFESKNYYKYIVKDGSNYYFSNSRVDNKDNYKLNSDFSGLDFTDTKTVEDCKDLFSNTFLTFMDNYIIKVIQIAVPILLILLTSFDFAKIVFSDDEKAMSTALSNLKTRGIAAVLIFLTPMLLIWIANLLGAPPSVTTCIKEISKTENK